MQNNAFSTLFIGQKLIKLIEVESTNTYMKDLLSNSEPLTEGTVIMADRQSAGRGQQGAVWESEGGKNLTASIYLQPKSLPLEKQFFLNIIVSLAVKDALNSFIDDNVSIKWPNDIYYNDRKIAGILIENTLSGTIIKSCVVGVGLNVNQTQFGENICDRTTSLASILDRQISIDLILSKICSFLEKHYLMLRAANFKSLHKRYSESLYLRGQLSVFSENGEVFEATITNVSDSGRLIMQTKVGERTFNFKEIKFLHTN